MCPPHPTWPTRSFRRRLFLRSSFCSDKPCRSISSGSSRRFITSKRRRTTIQMVMRLMRPMLRTYRLMRSHSASVSRFQAFQGSSCASRSRDSRVLDSSSTTSASRLDWTRDSGCQLSQLLLEMAERERSTSYSWTTPFSSI